MSTTAALAKSPASQSNAVGAMTMQLPAPMQRGRSILTWSAMCRPCPPYATERVTA